MESELWPHQRRAVEFALARRNVAIFYGMGTGKTRISIEIIARSGAQRVLVMCPKAVVAEWPRQFAKHCGDAAPPVLALSKGTGKTKAQQAASFNSGVVVVNYEAAIAGDLSAALLKWQPDMVICDESHRIKAPTTKVSKFAAKVSRNSRWRVCLTGTPTPNNPLDLFGQMRFLDERILGWSFPNFRARYAIMGGPQGNWVKGFKNQDELHETIQPHCLQVKTEDVVDLPPYVDVWRWGEFTPKTRRAYDALRDEMVAYINDEAVSVQNALVKSLRLQQLCSGVVPADNDGEVLRVETPKPDLLADIIDGLAPSEPLVVFGKFHACLDMAREVGQKAGREVYELSGRVRRERGLDIWAERVDAWREGYDANGKQTPMPIIVLQIQAGGSGINELVRARHCVFISTGFNNGDYEQARARLWRPGQEQHVVYYHLGVEGTVDADVAAALEAKQDLAAAVLSSLKSGK